MHLVPSLEASSLDLLCLHTPVPLALCTIVWAPISWAPLMDPRVASMVLQVTWKDFLLVFLCEIVNKTLQNYRPLTHS